MIPELPETITYPEAVKLYKCDRQSIRKAILKGDIIAYKPGKHVLIDLKTGNEWFLSTQQVARPKIGRPRRGAKRC